MNKVTRYWINGKSILKAQGYLKENGNLVIKDSFGERTIFNGYHFATKQEAFNDYRLETEQKIEILKNKIELVRAQL